MAPIADKNGIWGQPTSTLDWCEENYVVTPYIAEFWNTISNVVMIVPPMVCAFYYWKIGLEKRYVILNLALFVVGIGSSLFHMTLKYEMQLMDELPMIYGTAVLVYTLHHTSKDAKHQPLSDIVIPLLYCFTASAVYVAMKNPLWHQAFYGWLVILLFYKSVKACRRQSLLIPYGLASFFLYLIGFLLWNMDDVYCSSLRYSRSVSHSMYKPITQLHAWWHLLTGTATSLQIIFCTYARLLHQRRKFTVKMLGYCWPYISISNEEP